MNRLEVPDLFSGLGIKHNQGGTIEIVAGSPASKSGRPGPTQRYVDVSQFLIRTHFAPGRHVTGDLSRSRSPARACRIFRARHRTELPEDLASAHVESPDD